MLLGGIVAARRRFRIQVLDRDLEVIRRGPFGKRTFSWCGDELQSVRVVDSGTRLGNRSLLQVRVQPQTGDHLGILTGHSKAELASVATAIGEALELDES